MLKDMLIEVMVEAPEGDPYTIEDEIKEAILLEVEGVWDVEVRIIDKVYLRKRDLKWAAAIRRSFKRHITKRNGIITAPDTLVDDLVAALGRLDQ
jgi:hypothetical protein